VLKERILDAKIRSEAWAKIVPGSNRSFCRNEKNNTPLDDPIIRKVNNVDWRFYK
jgi:hypothetical protein